jgi:uncharacterized cupredoxin-like copper-binding protein
LNRRAFATLLPIAALVAACSSSGAAPSWTYDPPVQQPSSPSAAVTATPSARPSVSPSAAATSAAEPSPSAAVRTGRIPVAMTDAMRFVPDEIIVAAGEPITFVVRNDGVIVHEFFVGDQAEQEAHAKEMAAGGMGHGHDNAVSVEPGATELLTMEFANAETLLIGCHEPGHYAAGMTGRLIVVA